MATSAQESPNPTGHNDTRHTPFPKRPFAQRQRHSGKSNDCALRFFKWIKQHLRIKAFYGTSVNAVKTQVWIAISVYVLVAIVKKELRLPRSLADILQILSLTLFERVPLSHVVTAFPEQDLLNDPCNQLSLFDL
jgi:hypothetical protein